MGSQNKDPDLDHPTDEDALFDARILGKSIVLVGMMGVGKTTIGRRLAPKVGLPFRDADEEIERAAGMSVSDLFEKHGEPSFRRGETQVIERLLSGPPIVLATGGGAMTIEATRHVIKEKSVSVWLSADADTITTRARRRDTRPLLRTDNPRKTIETLMSEREQFYRQADLRVDSASGPHTKTVERLVEALQGFARKDTPS